MARRIRRKKARAHAVHQGGSWKVAYADFVTAMMALFLVLWLVSQGDQKLRAAIANYFRNPGVFETVRGNGVLNPEETSSHSGNSSLDTMLTTKEDQKVLFNMGAVLRLKLSEIAGKGRIRIEMTDEGLHIQILDDADRASFAMGSAELEPATRDILKEIASRICELPNPIQIGGHTDSYTFPGAGYTNWELSADRANAARRELETDCIKPERINRIVGYADTKPLIADAPFAPANRRISIMLMFMKAAAKEPTPVPGNPEVSTNGKPEAPATDKPAVSAVRHVN